MLGCPELKPQHYVYGKDAEPVKARLAAIFAERTQAEWTPVFAAADCCVSPILTMDESLANAQLRARGMVHTASDGTPRPALPVRFSEFEFGVAREAPASGEHSAEILRECGYSDADIRAFAASGVI